MIPTPEKMKKTAAIALIQLSFAVQAQETPVKDSAVQTQEIQEVVLKAQHKKQYVDKAVYTFDQNALDKARYAADLLKTLPELQYSPIDNKITSTKGGTLLTLINGIEATELQIRSIQPQNVVKVEYYDNPPTRWASRADTVVNIITRNPETGYVWGADVSSALTTGFVNGSAYAGYTQGRNDFGLEYSINLRDYDNRKVRKTYEYLLNGNEYQTLENRKDHFGYTDQYITLRYTNQLADRYAFQAKFNMEILTSFNRSAGQNVFSVNNEAEDHGTSIRNGSSYAPPTLDLYYSKNFGKKDEISFNVVGSAYETSSYETDKEWKRSDGESVFDNDMKLKARQNSIVGEVAYTHQFDAGKLSAGYRIANNHVSNELNNLSGYSEYTVNYLTQYLYSEFSGQKGKLAYRAGIGVTNIHNNSSVTTENDWTPNPKLVLSYTIAKNQSLRLTSDYTSKSPWADALSSNIVQTVPNIYRTGNPYLKPSHVFRNNLVYSFNNKYFDFNLVPFYNILYRDITQFYTYSAQLNGYALTYDNSDYTRQTGLQFSGSLKPFGNDLLVIKPYLQFASVLLKKTDGTVIRNQYLRNSFTLSSEYKNFSFQYQFNIPSYTLSGAFLNTNENQNHAFASYKLSNWTLMTGFYWIGMPSEYKTKSLSESVVNYSSHTQIMNNKNMFVLGISYDFAKGKQNNIHRKLNNDTAPAVTF